MVMRTAVGRATMILATAMIMIAAFAACSVRAMMGVTTIAVSGRRPAAGRSAVAVVLSGTRADTLSKDGMRTVAAAVAAAVTEGLAAHAPRASATR
jgi:hypothetical protein